MKSFLLLVLVAVAGLEAKVRYDNYRVYGVIPEDELQLEELVRLRHTYNFWREPRGVNATAHVMVHPNRTTDFESFLQRNGIRSQIEVHNVQDLLDSDEFGRSNTSEMNWNYFQNLSTIYQWLSYLQNKYSFVKLVKGGSSYENRTILGIEINFKSSSPGVVIESGMHARDWLAPAGTSWFVNKILRSSRRSILRRFNYLYFPVVNPDGYEYSWRADRMWRKTRKPYQATNRTVFYGADPNRNFPFQWTGSDDPSSEVYPGPKPYSEIETASLSKYLKSVARKRRNDIYLSYHSYGSLLMYPWSWTYDNPPGVNVLDPVAESAASAWAKVYGTRVTSGQMSKLMYLAGGTSTDWYYNQLNCTLTFIYEMRGAFFITPPENIVKAGREQLASLKRILVEYKKMKKEEKKTFPSFH